MTKRTDEGISRDAAGIGPHVRPGVRLVPLRELDHYDIADGEADIRGWPVQTVGGREVGQVTDLLVDTTTDEVVMLDVDLAGSDRHTLAPLRAAQVDRARRVVVMDSADLREVSDFPSLSRHEPLTDEEARLFSQRYDAAYGDRGWSRNNDWRVRRGADELRFNRRAADLGASAAEGAAAGAAAERAREVSYDRDVRDDARERAAERDSDREKRISAERDADRTARTREDADVRDIDEARRARDASAREDADREKERRDLRYAGADEVVVERRPVVVEEVVVRRRVLDAAAAAADDEDVVRTAMDPNVSRDERLRRDGGEDGARR